MLIKLEKTGRRFNREWIFRNMDYTFSAGQCYAVLGPNGSGKSTLLQVLSGSLSPSEGRITHTTDKQIHSDDLFNSLSIAAPYMELIEELTLDELIDFHFRFKRYQPGLDKGALVDMLGFSKARNKEIRYFSSGMKQRTKLALAVCADVPLLFLDEPTSNLDSQGTDWYLQLIEQHTAGKLVIVGSNQPHEYSFCKHSMNMSSYITV